MWIDAHAHLYELTTEQLRGVIGRAREANVQTIINSATDPVSCDTVREQCRTYPEVLRATVGISPFDAENLPEEWESHLRAALDDPRVVALGEAGLDLTNPRYPAESLQRPLLERQLAVAVEHSVPVVLHSRGAERNVAALCRSAGIEKALFHCFTGERKALAEILDSGYYVSFSGIVTFKNSPLPELVAYMPEDRILVETDTPYLAPVPHRGKRNQPAWVGCVGEHVARIRGIAAEDMAEQIRHNAAAFFGAGLQ